MPPAEGGGMEISMKFVIKHEIKGRIRLNVLQRRMTYQEADILQYYFESLDYIDNVKINTRIQSVTIFYMET